MTPSTQFIWAPGDTSPRNRYQMFRKTFNLDGQVKDARLTIFADSKYKLFVNGCYIGRGPARFDPRFPEYDFFEGMKAFREGKNCIAVLVHHYGEDTFHWIPRPACLVVHAEIDAQNGNGVSISTDKNWKTKSCAEWDRNSPKMDLQLGFAEIYDARNAVAGWTESDFDDGDWKHAVTIDRSAWGDFSPRSIPQLMEKDRPVEKLLSVGRVSSSPGVYRLKIRFCYYDWPDGPAFAYTYVHSPVEQTVWIGTDQHNPLDLWVNGQTITDFQISSEVPEQRRAPLPLRLGWNLLFAHIERTHDFFGCTLAFPSSTGLTISATRSPDDADSFFVAGPFIKACEQAKIAKLPCPPETPWDSRDLPSPWSHVGSAVTTKDIARLMTWETLGPADKSLAKMPSKGVFPIDILPDTSGRDIYLLFDFGEEVSGYPRIELDVDAGVILDMCYAEELRTERINPYKSNVSYADRYVTAVGCQSWETFSPRAFRYLQLVLRNLKNKATLLKVGVNFSTYPVEPQGSFECSDELLNRIWHMGRHTLQLCMEDAYIDCPWRERGQWWGDAEVEFLTNLATFGDRKLMARGLRQIALSRREDGRVNGVYPGRFNCYLADYELIWIYSLWDYYRHTGDIAIVGELFPGVQAGLAFFENRLNADGLIELDPDDPLLIDWVDIARGGAMTAINALLYRALRCAAKMAALCGNESAAQKYNQEAAKVSRAINRCLWDEHRGCYADFWRAGALSEEAHVHGNSFLLADGLVPDDRKERVVQFLEGKLTSIFEFSERLNREEQVVTTYFMYYVFEGLYAAGCDEFALNQMRQKWGWFLNRDATTCWEGFSEDNSLCHAWSTSPTYFMSAKVLGVEFPVAGDLSVVSIRPRTGDLTWARGKFPHPEGPIWIEWRREKSGEFRLNASLPRPMQVLLGVPRIEKQKALLLDNQPIWKSGKELPAMKGITVTPCDDSISVELAKTEHFGVSLG